MMPKPAPASLHILRERGPMSLREITMTTSLRLQCVLSYDDVAAVLTHERRKGTVRIHNQESADFREWVWVAVDE